MGSSLPEDVTGAAGCPESEPEPAAQASRRGAPRAPTPAPAPLALLLPPNRPVLSVAPMMAWTTHHFRQLMRMLTKRTLLYTEMYPADVVLQAASVSLERLETLIGFDETQRPLAVQLGGRDPKRLAEAAGLCAERGYDEVNINVGCPSETVSLGQCYGAALMREAGLVQELAAVVRELCRAVAPKRKAYLLDCDLLSRRQARDEDGEPNLQYSSNIEAVWWH
jgi:hypothetical protein